MTRSFILTATFLALLFPALGLPTAAAGPAGDGLDEVDVVCGNVVVALVDHPAFPGGPWPRACETYNGSVWMPIVSVRLCDTHQPSLFYRTVAQQISDKPPCSPSINATAHEYALVVDDAFEN